MERPQQTLDGIQQTGAAAADSSQAKSREAASQTPPARVSGRVEPQSAPGERTSRRPMRMTPAKLRAQWENAQKSTGPRTEAGRLRSVMYVGHFAWSKPRWDYRLRKNFGESSVNSMRILRKAVEEKLSLFGEIATSAREATPTPHIKPSHKPTTVPAAQGADSEALR